MKQETENKVVDMVSKPHFEIEQNIPVPPRRAKSIKYPLNEMELNDSFSIPFKAFDEASSIQSRVSGAAWHCGNNHNKKFTVRTLKDKKIIRVWRIE